ncbi:MAG: CDC48 family AAA ATPase [Thermacetogeniaceae bacterium]
MTELVLKTSEAMAKDVGRGNVRLDPADMLKAGLAVGDIITITGQRSTAARVLPVYPEYRNQEIMQLDGTIRQNAGLRLGDKGLISKTAVQPASQLVLTLKQRQGPFEQGSRQLHRLLEGLPITKGDILRIGFFGTTIELFVHDTIPAGPVLVESTTVIKLKKDQSDDGGQETITYEDVGGLAKELRKIREIIELPLKFPEVFTHLGIEPPRGVLLYGPPGTGKTLIARAIANETKASFFHVNGPEIINKYYGESEAKLREIFENARSHAPSIIFLDEIDAIAPPREEVRGDVEKRVVAQLLAIMDGLESRGQVIVIAATNIPNALDPALRRPGRFDREIIISVPDQKGRREILHIHTRGMPLADDVQLDEIARDTHGFVGADLEALCKEAAMLALRQVLPKLEPGLDGISLDLISDLQVRQQHFIQALAEIEPSATREVFVEIPHIDWDELGGLETVKQELREAVEWPLYYPDLLQRLDATPPRGVLLVGPPGTGKTLLARAVATASQANFISIKGPELFSKWVGESEKAVRQVFRTARQAAPCIIFFDEIDALVSRRGAGSDEVSDRVLGQLLTEMDGIEGPRGIIVLGATNRLDRLDAALLRPGRFDIVLTLPLPDSRAREQILRIHTRKKRLSADVNLSRLAQETEGLAGADLQYICYRATWVAIRRYLGTVDRAPDPSSLEITGTDFNEAISLLLHRPVVN